MFKIHFSSALSRRIGRCDFTWRLRDCLKNQSRLHDVGGLETFREPLVQWREKPRSTLTVGALHQRSSDAQRGTQLKRQASLTPGNLHRGLQIVPDEPRVERPCTPMHLGAHAVEIGLEHAVSFLDEGFEGLIHHPPRDVVPLDN
jgi:hypothetical protein